jgi:hypothetical protein
MRKEVNEMTEYTGQCLDRPDEGNLITSSRDRFLFEMTNRRWLDGDHNPPSVETIRGAYVWHASDGVFRWDAFVDPTGDWFEAGFNGECSRGGEKFSASAIIRADWNGGSECQKCVDKDEYRAELRPTRRKKS